MDWEKINKEIKDLEPKVESAEGGVLNAAEKWTAIQVWWDSNSISNTAIGLSTHIPNVLLVLILN